MNRHLKTAYWIATLILALWLLADGVSGLMHVTAGRDSLAQLGYPEYLLTIVGAAKLFAAIAIVQTRFRTIKEWAYAGLFISCVGAAASWYSIGLVNNAVVAIVFLLIMAIPYVLWRKVR